MKNVSNNQPFFKPNLVRCKSQNTNSIPIQFIKNNIRLPHKYLFIDFFHTYRSLFIRTNKNHRMFAVKNVTLFNGKLHLCVKEKEREKERGERRRERRREDREGERESERTIGRRKRRE